MRHPVERKLALLVDIRGENGGLIPESGKPLLYDVIPSIITPQMAAEEPALRWHIRRHQHVLRKHRFEHQIEPSLSEVLDAKAEEDGQWSRRQMLGVLGLSALALTGRNKNAAMQTRVIGS